MQGQAEIKDVDLTASKKTGDSNSEAKVRFIGALLERAKNNDNGGESRKQTFNRMDELQRYYSEGGKHKFKNMPGHRAKSITNKCYAVVEGAVPLVVDNRPKAEIIPGNKDDYEIAQQLKQVYDAKYESLNLEMKTTLAVKSALIRSEGYWKIFWNPLLMGGLGDVDVQIVDPKRLYFLGGSDPLLQDAFAVIYHGPHTIGELQAWYPKMAKAIKREWLTSGGSIDIDEKDVPDFMGMGRAVSDDGTGTMMPYFSAEGGGYDGSEQMMLTEVWIDDKSLYEESLDYLVVIDENNGDIGIDGEKTQFKVVGESNEENEYALTSQNVEYQVISGKDLPKIGIEKRTKMLRKYPFGRIMAKTGKLLLCDKPSYYTHGKSPYVRFFVCPIPGKNYFFGEIDQLMSLQDTLNKRDSQITDILSLTANPPMLVNIMSGIKPKKMTNRPGLIIPVNTKPQDAAQWMFTPNIPSALFADVERINDSFDTVSGYHDITAGRKPAGITAGVAIDSLQEASQTRYRQKARFVEYSLNHAAELMLSIIWEFYREPRVIRTPDSDNPGKYKFETINFGESKLVGGLPDVKIKAGSTMPTNEAVKRRLSMELLQIIAQLSPAGALAFLKEVFDKWDWENADAIYKAIMDAANGEKQQQITQ